MENNRIYPRTSGNGVETRPRGVKPHAIANELTDDRRVQAEQNLPGQVSTSGEPQSRNHVLNRTQRSIGRLMIGIIALLIVAAFLVAAALTGRWVLLGPALLVFIPFMIFLMLPVWLASSTKIAQDQAVKHQPESAAQDRQAISSQARR
jgi:hypothetical protein